MTKIITKKNSGFTLIELLVVIGILGVLLAIVLIAINPARQFAQANNTARRSDVNSLLNAIHQFAADNKGLLPANMPAKGAAAENLSSTGANICADISPTYIAQLPMDPAAADSAAIGDCTDETYDTFYQVAVDASGRVTVSADGAEAIGEDTPVIAVTR